MLTATGRKTGKLHTTPLIFGRDGDNFIVIASNSGDDRDPGWWRNLKAHPRATILVKRSTMEVNAEQANAFDKARLWPLMTAVYPGYDAYQKGTRREIPLVLLKPLSATPAGR